MVYKIIEKIAKNIFLRSFTVEAIKDFLKSILEGLKELTDKTENEIDDWVVKFISGMVEDDAKIEMIYNWIKAKLNDGKACYKCVRPVSSFDMLENLDVDAQQENYDKYDSKKTGFIYKLESALEDWAETSQAIDAKIETLELPWKDSEKVREAIKSVLDKQETEEE